MKVAIVGAGRLGTALARRLTLAGHEVCFAFGPDPSNARAAAERLGVDADAPTAAAAWAEVVALTVPWAAAIDALRGCGDLGAKPVWDCTNPIKPDFSGLEIGTTTSAAEELQAAFPSATIVKGIPPFAEVLQSDRQTLQDVLPTTFVCGPDGMAKDAVTNLLADLPAAAADGGPLESARYAEPAAFLLVRLAYAHGRGPRIGMSLLHESA